MPRTFLLLGSGEFEPWTHDVEARVLADASGDGAVLILPTASATEGDVVFDRWAKMGLDHYAETGVTAEVLPVKVREDSRGDGDREAAGDAPERHPQAQPDRFKLEVSWLQHPRR